jgi:dermatan/chondrotin sulfate uronyl 2-O-sulfotransferase UST
MRHTRRLTYTWFLILVTAAAGAGTLLLIAQRKYDNLVTTATVASVPVVTSSGRRVTKSLAELRKGVNIPELSDHVLFFNRVPKSGSEMLVLLLQWLQGTNGFRHIRLGGGDVRQLNRMQQVWICLPAAA